MKKIKSLFKRDYEGNRQVYNEVVEGSEWVINGEGVATRKYDGTSCYMGEGGFFYKRYDVKKGRKEPPQFLPAQEPDKVTGHWPGWIPVDRSKPEDKWHVEAWDNATPNEQIFKIGTYELVGPKIQGNPENQDSHIFIKHGQKVLQKVPRNFEGIKDYLKSIPIEGIVWHHPNGEMVKIKRKDFGFKWPIK